MSFHPGMGTRPHSIQPAHVSCVLPGLVWPGSGIAASLQALELPGLSALLGRGRSARAPAQPWSLWLAERFSATALPWADLRLAGEEGPESAPGHVLCADPVSLNFASDALLLRAPRELALNHEEVQALLDSLNAEFGGLGKWVGRSNERFYLLAHEAVDASFHPLAEVIGRPLAYFPPEGRDARRWNRIANEIQVMLHNHPVNQARSERGQLAANALWFWGQSDETTVRLSPPAQHLLGSDPLLRGLARRSGMQCLDDSERLCAGLPGHAWWVDTRLQEAGQSGDFMAWLAALQSIEHDMLRPLLATWQRGRIHEISLLAPSDKSLLTTRLSRRARWALWRKPLSPQALAGQLQQTPSTAPRA